MRKERTEMFGASFFGVVSFEFCGFTELILHHTSVPFGDYSVLYYMFTGLVYHPTSGPSGGHIFRYTTKDMGERRGKGVATHFHPPGVNVDMIRRIGTRRVRIGAPPEF